MDLKYRIEAVGSGLEFCLLGEQGLENNLKYLESGLILKFSFCMLKE